jgi:hypothetical protein
MSLHSWGLLFLVGYSHDLQSNGIQEVVGSIPIGAPSLVEGLLPLSTSTRGEPPLAHGEPLTKGIICSRVEWCLSVLRLHAFLR